jgi:ligand-binding sensor domain-containing protein/serine phosphatase RsbU (regulator of sigma subunit)
MSCRGYRSSLIILIAGLFLALSFVPAPAHNGAMAIAVPVEGIVIDGDFADWSEGLERYAIDAINLGTTPESKVDYQGWFQVGYNMRENALYVAVEMTDDSVVIDTTGGERPWNEQDGCEIYLDVRHGVANVVPAQYVRWGEMTNDWRGEAAGSVERSEGVHRYEWKIDVGKHSGRSVQLQSGMSVGFDVVLIDKDAGRIASWMNWEQAEPNRYIYSSHLGDLLLAADIENLSRIAGMLAWDDGAAILRGKVKIRSLEKMDLWVQRETDRTGRFFADLPAGNYQMEALVGRGSSLIRIANLIVGEQKESDLIIPSTQGVTKKAGAGTKRSVSAVREGAWKIFGPDDGLPPSSIAEIFQDNKGVLWLGTGGPFTGQGAGLFRYDGTRFASLTSADGLAGDHITSVLEDRSGMLWFGTLGNGVSCYDGSDFRNYSVADGLGNIVHCMLEDRSGNIWFGTSAGVTRYDGKKWKSIPIGGQDSNIVRCMLEDRSGRIWFGAGAGVSRYDGEQMEHLITTSGLEGGTVTAILQDRRGDIWLGFRSSIRLESSDESQKSSLYRYDGEELIPVASGEKFTREGIHTIVEDSRERIWVGTNGNGAARQDGYEWTAFTSKDGLANDVVLAIAEDRGGVMWLGGTGGLSRFDERSLFSLTQGEGLEHSMVFDVFEDSRGQIWLGTMDGLSRYDGESVTTFTAEDGLPEGQIWDICEDRSGRLCLATNSGLCLYDGRTFRLFSEEDGLVDDSVNYSLYDGDGNLWIATWGDGLSRYDGDHFETFNDRDGLSSNLKCITQTSEGELLFGTGRGIFRFDGAGFSSLGEEDRLTERIVEAISEDRKGNLWIGSWRYGLGHLHRDGISIFTPEHGLSHNTVMSVLEDELGTLWIGTFGGGVSRYDGQVFQNLLRADGLASNVVQGITQTRDGDMWIATEGGATRYRSSRVPPIVEIENVVADKRLGAVGEVSLPTTQAFLLFEFRGASLSTRPGWLVYLYRLAGYEEEWRQTREEQVEYRDLPVGEYQFEVKAVDKDLNYSGPATVAVTVHLPYRDIAVASGLGVALFGLVVAVGYGVKKRRDQLRAERALMQELEEELQTAHDLQMGLMPEEAPQTKGLNIAGRCLPANHVGGDFFQYHQLAPNRLAVSLADVTGHAMEAAIPVVMFSGVLESQIEVEGSLGELFGRLNRTMYKSLDSRTFVCFAMGEFNADTKSFRYANSGCPYPLHFRRRTGEVDELQVDAYPLGVRPEADYLVKEVQLEIGDQVVFCSDGIVEAENAAGELFGFERVVEIVARGGRKGLSVEDLLEQIFEEVEGFSKGVAQGDDQTIVVLEVTG